MTTTHDGPLDGPPPSNEPPAADSPAPDGTAGATHPAGPADETGLPGTVFRLAALLARHERHPHPGAHRGQGRVLALLSLREPLGQKDLGYLLGVRSQSLGELLAKLERAGLVRRTPDETDRRSMTVELTDAGRRAADEAKGRATEDDPFAVLTSEQRDELAALLALVVDSLRAQDGDLRGGPHGWRRDGFPPGAPDGPFGPDGPDARFGPGGRGGPRGQFGPRRGRRRPDETAEMAMAWVAALGSRRSDHRGHPCATA
ncbi:MAG: MarR family transcriptional regulator [Cellulomonas sp.]|nr:MarR family transcriptional regulator [Cellulomonas sp.]